MILHPPATIDRFPHTTIVSCLCAKVSLHLPSLLLTFPHGSSLLPLLFGAPHLALLFLTWHYCSSLGFIVPHLFSLCTHSSPFLLTTPHFLPLFSLLLISLLPFLLTVPRLSHCSSPLSLVHTSLVFSPFFLIAPLSPIAPHCSPLLIFVSPQLYLTSINFNVRKC